MMQRAHRRSEIVHMVLRAPMPEREERDREHRQSYYRERDAGNRRAAKLLAAPRFDAAFTLGHVELWGIAEGDWRQS